MAEALLTELKGGVSSFSLMGTAVVRDNALQGIQQKEGSTWRHVDSSFGVSTGEGNTVYARIWGGYKTDNPILRRWNNDNEFVEIKWENRLAEGVIDDIRPSELFRAGFEKDEDGRLITKEFLSEIDFEEYLIEHLADGMPVRVRGDVEYNEYNDDIYRRYNVKSVFLAETYTNKEGEVVTPKPLAQVRQTYLLDEDALDKRWEKELQEDGRTTLSLFVPQYLSTRKVGDKYVPFKKTVPLHQGVVVKMSSAPDEKEIMTKKKIMDKFFKVKRDTVREIVLVNNINEGYEEATGVEINDELQELIDLGIMTEDDIKNQVTIRGNKVSELVFAQPAVLRNRDTGEVRLQLDDSKYAPEALIVPFIDGEDDFGSEEEEGTTISDDEFASLFG